MAKNSKPHVVKDDPPADPVIEENQTTVEEQLDEDEAEFRALRRDLPGVKGASAAGIVTISVGKAPAKNEFFRVHPGHDYRPTFALVDIEVGMERQYFAVTPSMVAALASIEISVSDFTLYFTTTSGGALRIVPVRAADGDGDRNTYAMTKEMAMFQAMTEWVRLSTDQKNQCYKIFSAPVGRFGEPQWPDLKPAKIIRLAFRDKGRLIDSTEHALFRKWAARDVGK